MMIHHRCVRSISKASPLEPRTGDASLVVRARQSLQPLEQAQQLLFDPGRVEPAGSVLSAVVFERERPVQLTAELVNGIGQPGTPIQQRRYPQVHLRGPVPGGRGMVGAWPWAHQALLVAGQ